MPWCSTCSRFLNPNSLHKDGTCPACGHQVADPDELIEATPPEKMPWHFKLLVLATVVYLGWRLVQMIGWLVT
jgi:hypothetical protein